MKHKSPSGPFRRLLEGKITVERYCAIVRRAVRMQMKREGLWW